MAESGWVERAAERIDRQKHIGISSLGIEQVIREEYAKDELRVAAVELCKQLLQDNAPAPLVSSRALARRVLRLAGEA